MMYVLVDIPKPTKGFVRCVGKFLRRAGSVVEVEPLYNRTRTIVHISCVVSMEGEQAFHDFVSTNTTVGLIQEGA